MEQDNKKINELRDWLGRHTVGALNQSQPQFWIVFWLAVAFSAALYYFTYEPIAAHIGQKGRSLLSISYLSVPLLVLRNLHRHAFVVLGISILALLW